MMKPRNPAIMTTCQSLPAPRFGGRSWDVLSTIGASSRNMGVHTPIRGCTLSRPSDKTEAAWLCPPPCSAPTNSNAVPKSANRNAGTSRQTSASHFTTRHPSASRSISTAQRIVTYTALWLGITFAALVAHAEGPHAFRGIHFGASRDSVIQKLRIQRNRDFVGSTINSTFCRNVGTLAGAQTNEVFHFEDDQLRAVFITVRGTDYETLRGVIIERFGQPKTNVIETARRDNGETYDRDVLTWASDATEIRLLSNTGAGDATSRIALRSWIADEERKKVDARKAAAKEF